MAYLEKICCFFVFARIFLHMCPNATYEKYLSALTSWIAFFIFLTPFLSGDLFTQTYENWEKNWKVQAQMQIGVTAEELEEESEREATRILEEMSRKDEIGTDN